VIIDAHAHFIPSGLLEALRSERRLFPSVKVLSEGAATRMAFMGQEPTRPISPKLSDLGQRQAWLDSQKIDRQVVGGWLDMFGYELPPDEAADWCRFINEHLLSGAAQSAALTPLACVPLQSGKLAAAVLEDALAAGFTGIMIGTQPNGVGGTLDGPDLDVFWEVASAREVSVFIHPMFACGDDRLGDYDLVNAVGRLTDTTTAVARLLFSGHLQRFPGVKLIISHGGAALPFALGRLRRNHAIHPGKYADPMDGFRRLYFDTVLFEARALRFLCDVAGSDKVLLGSDHPFPIGDAEPLKVVDDAALSATERRAVLGDTAAHLFHIPGGCSCGAAPTN
jgi:aminocarboxymuconate-semialdehyde decarboxylase